MADVKTTTYTTNYDKSLAEDVDKMIGNVAPTDTPYACHHRQGNLALRFTQNGMEDTLDTAWAEHQPLKASTPRSSDHPAHQCLRTTPRFLIRPSKISTFSGKDQEAWPIL